MRALVAVLLLTGCGSLVPQDPIVVPTQYGSLVCQLYGHQGSALDHAAAHPSKMTQATADSICRNVGSGILDWNDI